MKIFNPHPRPLTPEQKAIIITSIVLASIVIITKCYFDSLNTNTSIQTTNQNTTQHLSLKDSLQKIKDDSIKAVFWKAAAKRDSINQVKAQRTQDSIQRAYYRTPAGRIQKLHPEWSDEDCQKIANNKIWIGMSINMVRCERGAPQSSTPSNYGYGNQWQCCWDDYSPSCFYCGDDGIITAYN